MVVQYDFQLCLVVRGSKRKIYDFPPCCLHPELSTQMTQMIFAHNTPQSRLHFLRQFYLFVSDDLPVISFIEYARFAAQQRTKQAASQEARRKPCSEKCDEEEDALQRSGEEGGEKC